MRESMPTLLISVAVFESIEYVGELVANTLWHTRPSTLLVLHLNREAMGNWSSVVPGKLTYPVVAGDDRRVYLNPERLLVRLFHCSVWGAHLSNIRYALQLEPTVTHILLHASNELFFRHGVEEHGERQRFALIYVTLMSSVQTRPCLTACGHSQSSSMTPAGTECMRCAAIAAHSRMASPSVTTGTRGGSSTACSREKRAPSGGTTTRV